MVNFLTDALQNVVTNVLKQGPIPKHIGIIMDGNRRYAKKHSLGHAVEGHRKGEQKINVVLDLVQNFGIEELTIYCFSTENFNRPQDEVDGLMNLFVEVNERTLAEIDWWHMMGRGNQLVGDFTLIPTSKLRSLMAKVMWSTRSNYKFQLNIAFIYTAQTEIANGLNKLLSGLAENQLRPSDLNEKLVQEAFTARPMYPVDMIIRTGGDSRLSDFLLWQGSGAHLEFVSSVMWPEFGYRNLIEAILRYQIGVKFGDLRNNHLAAKKKAFKAEELERKTVFLERQREILWATVKEYSLEV